MERVSNWPDRILLASPRGFCAGVRRAIDVLRSVQEQNPNTPIFSYHEIIHNTHIVSGFERSGVTFVNSLGEVPDNTPLVFSAHGVSPAIMDQAQQRRLSVVDTTCPLVSKTHTEAQRYISEGLTVLYIGHKGHDETVGTLGFAPDIKLIETAEEAEKVEVPDPLKVALITQTTLSFDDAEVIRDIVLKRFPATVTPKVTDICFATQNRQDGVKEMVRRGAEAVVVCGSLTSSNSTRLKEVALAHDAESFFVDEASQLNPSDFRGFSCIGLTSGASAPEDKFQEIEEFFRSRGSVIFEEVRVADESMISFAPPK